MSLNVTEEITIDAPADAVWKVVGDFFGLSQWLPTTPCEVRVMRPFLARQCHTSPRAPPPNYIISVVMEFT